MAIEISISASRSWDKEYLLELGENRPELLLFYGHKVTKTVTETCLSQWYPCKFEADGVFRTSFPKPGSATQSSSQIFMPSL